MEPDFTKSKYFERSEFVCNCGCDRAEISQDLLTTLERIREKLGEPMVVSSGYRCENHPVSKEKIEGGAAHGGAHHLGLAVDVHCAGVVQMNLLALALAETSINGIGINARGPWNSRFVHIDIVPTNNAESAKGIGRPALWGY
jgi:zinc D-Ala-D-Ala carboxypeptidase